MSEGFLTSGDGCRLHFRWDGPEDAPVLLLSNSLGTALSMWEPQVNTLAAQFRMLRYDTRGHGRSDAPVGAYSLDRLGRDVLELTDGLGVKRFSFCGLSLGGMIGQWLGWRAPERLDKLVIANSSPCMGPPEAWDSRIAAVLKDGMEIMVGPAVERWFTPLFAGDPANIATVVTSLRSTSPQGYAGCCAAIRDMDMRPTLGLILASTLIIGGSRDPATPPEHSRQLVTGIRGAQCVMLDAAHLSNQEAPAEFSAALKTFLGGRPTGVSS